MNFVILGFLCVFVFLCCFLVDMLVKKITKKKQDSDTKTVKMPQKSAVFGIILICFAVAARLFWIPDSEWKLQIGTYIIALMGIVLLVHYKSFSILYDDIGFTVRELFKKERRFDYSKIEGQRSLMTRGGINATLFADGDSVMLTSAMQGAQEFLSHAFYKWCAIRDIDPDTVENNPRMMTFFPDKNDA